MATAIHKLAPNGKAVLKGFSGSAFARFLTSAQNKAGRLLIIAVEDQKRASGLEDEIRFFHTDAKIEILPAYDVLPYYGLSPHPQVLNQTIRVLFELGHGKLDYLIVPTKALFRRHLPKSLYEKVSLKIVKDFAVDREGLISDLVTLGYERSPVVEESGQFAVRGDIIDVFSPHAERPLRVSFFDRDVESIKAFDPASQRTEEELYQANIIPTREIFLDYFKKSVSEEERLLPEEIKGQWKSELKSRADNRDILKTKRDQVEDFILHQIYFHGIETFLPLFYCKTDSLFAYLPKDSLLVRDTTLGLVNEAGRFLAEITEHRANSDHVECAISPEEIYLTPEELQAELAKLSVYERDLALDFPESDVVSSHTESNQLLRSKITSEISKIHNLAPLASELNQKRLEGIGCFIVCRNDTQLERINDLLTRFELPLSVAPEARVTEVLTRLKTVPDPARLVHLIIGSLHEGFLDHDERQWWITDEEIFGKKTRRATTQTQKTAVFSSFADLSEGDYIIHMDHGIGIYRGLVKLDFDVNKNDFLMVEYLGGDKLYVPVDRLNRVQRYIAEEGSVPQLDKLGGTTWQKVRQKAKKAARKLAAELLKLQAKRESLTGHFFSSHHQEMMEFATGFEFEETPDQARAIDDVIRDMISTKPMDRLVCGDVGFGKTEVAIRAAYKSVLDHKQVAILVPTTVLAFQHYTNFKKRFETYAVNVELLSRFRSASEQNAAVKKIKEGAADIVVGTHRLLSEDVKFRDLGLLIIDEEHRFGVVHKEKIKKLKNLVDVMTLTATPIPRTLNFALNGIRDLSIINTPPQDRMAVKTYTCSFDSFTLRDAMLKELKRGGQIYFVHNRVQSIEKITKQVADLMPEARVKFAHGQMGEDQLERIMIDFMNHEFDILVCTTIIESGLDIPNCNTMIINRADGLGLAQLYQLRGRVGRSHHQAYCYLIVPDEELINAKAKKRLIAIQKFTELGSGFKIASHDLEIRGAGNILGDEQSGHIAAIGYDMYLHLLKEAIHELKNEAMPEDFSPEVTLNVAAKIPEDFVPDAQLRLILYKQLSSSESAAEVDETREDWADRFGKTPLEVQNLMELIKLRILCKKLLVASVKSSSGRLVFSFHPSHTLNTQVLVDAVQRNSKKFSITRDGQFVVTQEFKTAKELLDWCLDFLQKMEMARES